MTQSIRVFGVPGAGKTTRLISMLRDLNKKYRMREIIYCSYTTAAVNEVKERIKDRYESRDLIWFKTLHGICFRLLNTTGKPASKRDRIEHLNKFSAHFDMEFLIDSLYQEDPTEEQVVKWIHKQLDELMLTYPEVSDTEVLKIKLSRMVGPRLSDIMVRYKLSWFVHCKQNDIFEFNRLLLDVYRRKLVPDARVLIVDEYQDINHLQNLIIDQFSDKMEMVINAGDHNQSIYGFRGADPSYLKKVRRDSEINLMDTHRLPRKIVEYTKRIIPDDEMVQNMQAISDSEGELELTALDRVSFEGFESVFILARTNNTLKEVRSRLMQRGIVANNKKSKNSKVSRLIRLIDRIENDEAIHHRDLKLFSDKKLRLDKLFVDWNMQKLFYDWMGDAQNKDVRDEISTELLRGMMAGDYRQRTISLVKDRHDRIVLENYLIQNSNDIASNIQLMTIHGSKGKEADLVVLINQASGFEYRDDLDEDEERRVYYVGVTRARQKLVIAYLDDDKGTWTRFLPPI